MYITSKLATTIFAPSLPVYRALSTPPNTDTNRITFCNVNATSGQSCSWNANRCSSCHILITGKLLHKTLRYFCFMLHRTLLRDANGHGEQGFSNSSKLNPVQRHETENNVSRPPAKTKLDMAKNIYLNCKCKIHASFRFQEHTKPETTALVHETVYCSPRRSKRTLPHASYIENPFGSNHAIICTRLLSSHEWLKNLILPLISENTR